MVVLCQVGEKTVENKDWSSSHLFLGLFMENAGKVPLITSSAKPFDHFIEIFHFFLHFCKRTFTMFYLSVNYLQSSLRIELQTDVFDPACLDRFRCILFFSDAFCFFQMPFSLVRLTQQIHSHFNLCRLAPCRRADRDRWISQELTTSALNLVE